MRKVEFSRFQNGMTVGTVNAWGIQIGPFVALAVPFVSGKFQLFHFHTGRPILIAL